MNGSAKKETKIPIIDFHCDLLLYLAGKNRAPYHEEARCSYPQLEKGNVQLQTLAIYTQTSNGSHERALQQLQKYKSLPKPPCKFLVAIENASGLLGEGEDIALLFPRVDHFQNEAGPLLYISLTWNTENRFGGGNESTVGLKEDGKRLLDYLDGKKIAIDLSHTSDALAHDILQYLDNQGLAVTPVASHSNFRKVCDVPRNLPDDYALEIIRRGGVIGINLVRKFVGDAFEENFLKMVEHAEKLNALSHLCLGADFFYTNDIPFNADFFPYFAEKYGDASCYPRLLALLQGRFSESVIHDLAYKNATRFLERERLHAHSR